MGLTAKEDRIRALEASDRFEPQLERPSLPTEIGTPAGAAPGGDTWSGSYAWSRCFPRVHRPGGHPSALR